MRMNFSCNGEFFLPNKPEEKVLGILQYEKGNFIRLNLNDSFENATREKYSHILGHTPYGFITLIEYKDISFHFGEVKCDFTYMFMGNVLPKKEDLLFNSGRVFLNTLNEWVNVSGFSIDKSGLISN